MTDYSVDYFIANFEAIPEGEWCRGAFERNGKRCALGHCGYFSVTKGSNEGRALLNLLPIDAAAINDARVMEYQQPTPKQRILAALRDIKSQQC